jgi:hypothetical protein
MEKMTLIRAADMAEVGTMDANQRLPAALLRGVPTGHPVRCVMERGVHSRDPQANCPPIPDGFLTNEWVTVRIPATTSRTTDA